MNANGYMIAAYTVGLTLLWGYAIALWRASRAPSSCSGSSFDRKSQIANRKFHPRGATP